MVACIISPSLNATCTVYIKLLYGNRFYSKYVKQCQRTAVKRKLLLGRTSLLILHKFWKAQQLLKDARRTEAERVSNWMMHSRGSFKLAQAECDVARQQGTLASDIQQASPEPAI